MLFSRFCCYVLSPHLSPSLVPLSFHYGSKSNLRLIGRRFDLYVKTVRTQSIIRPQRLLAANIVIQRQRQPIDYTSLDSFSTSHRSDPLPCFYRDRPVLTDSYSSFQSPLPTHGQLASKDFIASAQQQTLTAGGRKDPTKARRPTSRRSAIVSTHRAARFKRSKGVCSFERTSLTLCLHHSVNAAEIAVALLSRLLIGEPCSDLTLLSFARSDLPSTATPCN
ncbi:hypothetical protein PHSY_001759 [Pseudozyma hubeiensis SY62]|uniref:Uncharacterized protein n=1 Tax=Pseudozyma hubeiensis (strain SY62) TaxID=1305764 RepID=R9NZB1_PSEHS|nr:hypothetical protein PHSY_001759 [Pseudozyma hubeiensis SY62]GAC94188.1 hypothetical protein PHSY_001759 [Pseudozyma hubeiensis SY62]